MNPIKENIIEILGLDKLSQTEREDILLSIGSIIYQEVLMRVMETMSDKNKDEFEKLLDENSKPEEIFEFFRNKAPDFEKIIKEETEKFESNTSSLLNEITN